jgi:cytochrome c oxidase subunit 3
VAAVPVPRRLPLLTVGIVIFLGSELMFFASLFAMYFTLRAEHPSLWPPPGTDLAVLRPALFTAVLVGSSFTMQMADRRIKQGNPMAMRRWIWLTMAMGLIFLFGQAWDYHDLTRQGVTMASSAYGSAFYTMTGFHALHVTAGLIVMLVVLGRAATGAYDHGEHAAVEAATYYWHFVDIVWVALFLTLFVVR